MNVILVPALLLLIGLAVYKKVIEPRRAAGGQRSESTSKASKAPKPATLVDTKPDKKAFKARASSGSGRMGSVL